MRPARYDLYADRNVAFLQTFDLYGYDLTAPGMNPFFAAQVRLTRDAGQEYAGGPAAPPLINLPLVTTDVTGLKIMDVRVEDGVPVTTLRLFISTEDIRGLPLSSVPGQDIRLAWDLQFSSIQVVLAYLVYGDFILLARATYS